ncbi:hypothetical protein NDU88_002413 [Pleurodeles waltl]|uniref:Uncharacterized protein n=1 Tax=Pleurodeles waltl TaxID=8319 RepID=A0AAV7P6W9_PLEWA|nr:hypothetical protein NDU88_002413 [Pleurodeles waltl]
MFVGRALHVESYVLGGVLGPWAGRAVDGSWVGLMGKVRDIMVSPRVVITPSAVVTNFSPALDILSLPGLGMVTKRRPSALRS